MRTEQEFQELVAAEMRKQQLCILCENPTAKAFGLCVPDEYKKMKLNLPDGIIKLFAFRLCDGCLDQEPTDMMRRVADAIRRKIGGALS